MYDRVIQLDPERYAEWPEAFGLAKALAPLVESKRNRRRGSEQIQVLGLLGHKGYPSDTVPWFELACDVDVVVECAAVLGLSQGETATSIAERLAPPNWLAFFWMGQWFTETYKHNELAVAMPLIAKRYADLDRKIRAKQANDAAHSENREAKQQAIDWYLQRRGSMSKDEAARQISSSVMPYKFRTIRGWLNGV